MAISAEERDELQALAQDALGARGAELLMAGLAQGDLDAMEERLTLRMELLRSDLTGRFDRQFGELRGEMGELRGQFGDLRGEMGELRGEMGELRGEMGELRGEFGELRGEFGDLKATLAGQRTMLYVAIVTTVFAVLALMYAAFQAGTQP